MNDILIFICGALFPLYLKIMVSACDAVISYIEKQK
jgi:hypothetical protein